MTAWLKQLLVQWSVCRIVRIAGGLPIMIMGIKQHDWPVILFGAAFLLAGLLSVQCCTADGCTPRYNRNKPAKTIEFEELKN
jgi:hypothetical protein